MPEQEKKEAEAITEKATTDLNLTQRIESVIKDVLDQKLKALELAMDKKIVDILKAKEIEMESALRKGFGLEADPVVHQSDLIVLLRKAGLENAESQKRTPAPTEKAGPEGAAPSKDSFDEAVKAKLGAVN